MRKAPTRSPRRARRGAVLVLASALLIVIFAFVAFTIDVGYMCRVKVELQNAADAAALAGAAELGSTPEEVRAAAVEVAGVNRAAGEAVVIDGDTQVELGQINDSGNFVALGSGAESNASAVRVTTRANDLTLFFAPVIGHRNTTIEETAVATFKPRDIMLVVDLSGSMNDDGTVASMAYNNPADVQASLQSIWTDLGSPTYGSMGFNTTYVADPNCTPSGDDDDDDDDDWDWDWDDDDDDDDDWDHHWRGFGRRRRGFGRRRWDPWGWDDDDDDDDWPFDWDDDDDDDDDCLTVQQQLGLTDVNYPYAGGTWDDYINYVQTDPALQTMGYQNQYGMMTLVDYWLNTPTAQNGNTNLSVAGEQPITALKQAVQLFVDYLNSVGSEDRVGLSAYTYSDGTAILEHELGTNIAQIASTVWDRQAGHYDPFTNIGAGMQVARLELQANARPGADKVMVLMTDGLANRPSPDSAAEQFVLDEANAAAAANIVIMTVSLGRNADRDLMQDVADITGGIHYNVPGNYNVTQYTAELLNDYQTIAADRSIRLAE